ncbi:hypothetical protein G6F42_015799 [Rhizopus arrhizus]|nr:hypothetical protein G6F42_015799 [Rhizopus arrhizus]
MDIQSRGPPHIHFVMWTGHTKEQLMANPNLISTAIPNPVSGPDLYNLLIHTNMDVQINNDENVLFYLAKHLIKMEDVRNMTLNDEPNHIMH